MRNLLAALASFFLMATIPAMAAPCLQGGVTVALRGHAAAVPSANGERLWVLATDKPFCLMLTPPVAPRQRVMLSRAQIVGSPPPTDAEIELSGILYASPLTAAGEELPRLVVHSGRRIQEAARQAPSPPSGKSDIGAGNVAAKLDVTAQLYGTAPALICRDFADMQIAIQWFADHEMDALLRRRVPAAALLAPPVMDPPLDALGCEAIPVGTWMRVAPTPIPVLLSASAILPDGRPVVGITLPMMTRRPSPALAVAARSFDQCVEDHYAAAWRGLGIDEFTADSPRLEKDSTEAAAICGPPLRHALDMEGLGGSADWTIRTLNMEIANDALKAFLDHALEKMKQEYHGDTK